MFNLGMGEITVILLLILLFVGPKKLPEMAAGLGRAIRQIRKTTADVKNEIVLDDTFRKPFEELRDAVTLAPEELKRRDELKEAIRRQAEELERTQREVAAAVAGEAPADPVPEPIAREGSAPWATPPANFPPPPPAAAPSSPMAGRPTPSAPIAVPSTPSAPMAPPVGTFPRAPTPAPLPPGRLGGPPRVTPPISSLDGRNANTTQTLTEEDLLPLKKGAPPPPLPPPLPGVPPVPGTKKG
jgi:sec-independent protein translocase protein TatB